MLNLLNMKTVNLISVQENHETNLFISNLCKQNKWDLCPNYRPSFLENKPKTLVFFNERFGLLWACFRENWVFNLGTGIFERLSTYTSSLLVLTRIGWKIGLWTCGHPSPPTPQSRQSAKRFSSRWNWDSPTPLAAGECAPPPPLWSGGEGTLACG